MIIKTKKQTEVEEIKSIRCDICNTTYDDPMEIQECLCISADCGYGSVFGDGTHVECDICQYCLKKMIGEHCREMKHHA